MPNYPAVYASVMWNASCCELIEISSARTACASWGNKNIFLLPQSPGYAVIPVASFLFTGMRVSMSALLQCHSPRMWQKRIWWVLLIFWQKIHWDSEFFSVVAPLEVCGQAPHAVTDSWARLIFNGESYKDGCKRSNSTFLTVAEVVVVVSPECTSPV